MGHPRKPSVEPTSKELAIRSVQRFLDDDSRRVFLLRGGTDFQKIKVALACLNRTYSHGVIRTSNMHLVPELVNGAYGKAMLPNALFSTQEYKLGRLHLHISRYDGRTKRNLVGNVGTFTLYLLAPDALNDEKRYKAFAKELATPKSSKVLIMTINERNVRNWDLTQFVDSFHTYGIRRRRVV